MNRRYQEFKNFIRRGMFVVFLFCLAIMSMTASVAILLKKSDYNMTVMLPSAFGLITTIIALILIRKNSSYIKTLSSLLLSNYVSTDIEKFNKFNRLVDENLFQYYFQPIVNSRTGEVFAYEALMRTDDPVSMNPAEILDFASRENRLGDIEKLTFYNTLSIMRDNLNTFGLKKLFINSISDHMMKDIDFDKLLAEYGPLFDNVVLEISESALLDDIDIKAIQKRLQDSGCQLALDDYGAGYSNESILLETNPNYLKIDQKILRNIDSDMKKQQLVSNIVNFASKNHIKTIAEGVETYEEFVSVIKLGVDFVQGYYTGRPNPVLLQTIPDECLDTVYALNQSCSDNSRLSKTYETDNNSVILSLVGLSENGYTDVYINDKEITLLGTKSMIYNLRIKITDNLKCNLTLDNVGLRAGEPTITLGENCCVTMKLVGDNNLHYDGIRVPETSSLTIIGEGNLTIKSNRRCGNGIGGSADHFYGNISFAGSGKVRVNNNGERIVGIGGGRSSGNSKINLISGQIHVDVSGTDVVGIGCTKGNADIEIGDCFVQVNSVASRSSAIGCLSGPFKIISRGNLKTKSEGNKVVSIGSLDGGEGSITILDGKISVNNYGHTCTGIGGIKSDTDINIENTDIRIYAEASEAVGIGDYFGTGSIRITNGIISTEMYSSHPVAIGNTENNLIIDGCNIQSNTPMP